MCALIGKNIEQPIRAFKTSITNYMHEIFFQVTGSRVVSKLIDFISFKSHSDERVSFLWEHNGPLRFYS